MFGKYLSVLYCSVLFLGMGGAVFAQDVTDHPVITVDNAANLEPIVEIAEADKYMRSEGLTFSPDNQLLAFNQDSAIQLLDVTSNEVVLTIPGISFPVWLVFMDDGKALAAVTTSYLDDISSWDVTTGEELPAVIPEESTNNAYGAILSPDGSLIAISLDGDKGIRIIETATGATVTTIPVDGGRLAISADNETIAIGDANTKIELWDIATTEIRLTLESPSLAYEDPIFSADSTLIAGCNSNDGVDIWDAETGEVVLTMSNASCGRGAFSPDNTLFATGPYSTTIYNVATGEELFKIEDTNNVAFSPDGTLLATVSDYSSTLKLWAVAG